jgi:hypothetical protein
VRPQLSVELDEWILFYDEIFAATTVVVLFILAGQFSQSTVLRLVTIPICMPATCTGLSCYRRRSNSLHFDSFQSSDFGVALRTATLLESPELFHAWHLHLPLVILALNLRLEASMHLTRDSTHEAIHTFHGSTFVYPLSLSTVASLRRTRTTSHRRPMRSELHLHSLSPAQ